MNEIDLNLIADGTEADLELNSEYIIRTKNSPVSDYLQSTRCAR